MGLETEFRYEGKTRRSLLQVVRVQCFRDLFSPLVPDAYPLAIFTVSAFQVCYSSSLMIHKNTIIQTTL